MGALILRLLANAAALYVAVQLVPGISFEGGWVTLLVVALIFGIVNALVRPLLTALTCPLLILTLGLFTFIINALMLALTSWIAQSLHLGFRVEGFGAALVGAIVIGVVSFILTLFIRDESRDRKRA